MLITGAAGSIGRKLLDYLRSTGAYRLTAIDRRADPSIPELRVADLSQHVSIWSSHFDGIDTVVHLAAFPGNGATWDDVIPANIDGILNVYSACVKRGVRRVVFASSVWPMSGYRFGSNPITSQTPPLPTNPYGSSKLFGERVAKVFFEAFGVETIVLRLGACLRSDNRPSSAMVRGDWQQSHWLSDRDMCQAFHLAIERPVSGFALYHVASDISGSRWDIESTRRELGYAPQDRHTVKVTTVRALQARVAMIAFHVLPAALRKVIPPTW